MSEKYRRKHKNPPQASAVQIMKLLEATYALVHFTAFLSDKNTPQVMEQMISGDELQMYQAASYLAARHEAIDHLLATAKPKERGGDE